MKPIIEKLTNGLTVSTIEKPYSYKTALAISIAAGTFNEEGFPQGIAHFVEHMMFKGTKNRTAKEVNKEVNQLGGGLNAFTYYEETKYYVTLPSNVWEKGMEVLLDLIANPLFPENEVESERNVILEEIKMYADDPTSNLFDAIQAEIFKDYPNRQSVLGTEESVNSITRDDIVRFVRTFYKPENMTLVAVGNLRHEDVVDAVKRFELSYSPLPALPIKPFVSYELDSHIELKEDCGQAHLSITMFGPDIHSDDTTAFELMALMLGGNESSRLFQQVREERGLAYNLLTTTGYLSDYGIFTAYFGTGEEHFETIEGIVIDALNDIAINGVSEEELSAAKAYMNGRTMMDFDSNGLMNDFVSHAMVYGLPSNPLQQIDEVNAVTVEDIKRVTSKYVGKDSYITAVIMPKYTVEYEEEVLTEAI